MPPAELVMVTPVPADRVFSENPLPLPIKIWPLVGVLTTPVPPCATLRAVVRPLKGDVAVSTAFGGAQVGAGIGGGVSARAAVCYR
jgi:hypothetical protein